MCKTSHAIWNGDSTNTKVHEGRMEVAEMEMLNFSLALTRINSVRKILGTRRLGDKARWSREEREGDICRAKDAGNGANGEKEEG